ncbi:TetR/AcrR family transcriptional regulator [Pelomonas sp. P7]|uniref:TetR/AcrR family transcriptional regulator n=1 Tax=Pelomonas caseinilytica TaxID=2906763 RepID=A0ABS8XDR9_9BURK|nr:TetR/AcrR family transcriptional regulator [Pelomonas sp. P7]MCE4537875.1 TetR/AcrR family transcriptional regulator [Pelomonas sp. P7]
MMIVIRWRDMKKSPTPSRKEISHERILDAATRAIRRSGYAGTGVADIMKEAGLTHGGFYAHFESRDALLAEAADRAGQQTVATLRQLVEAAPPAERYRRLVAAYLSRAHADLVETGCPVAAVGSEMPRQAPEVRHAATRRIKDMIDLVASVSPGRGGPGGQAQALSATATMVGALILARAVDDPKLADAVLESALHHLAG